VKSEVESDFRKQTLSNLNHQYFLSGVNSTASVNKESAVTPSGTLPTTPLTNRENLHSEIFDLKEQLRQAITLSEEQAFKRNKAEQQCIKLAKEL
jgi:hypothetical protein